MARFFVGSVANYCLRNATMPVVMVRPGERAKTRRSRVVFGDERDASFDSIHSIRLIHSDCF